MERINIRLTEAEKAKIEQLAAKAELSVSDYIRKSALKAKITPRFTDEDAIRTGSRGLAPCPRSAHNYERSYSAL